MHIFVYGTLREGDSRNSAIQGAERLPGVWTVPGTLHSLQAFPALVLGEEETQVVGEVYFIPPNLEDYTLGTLDSIEGVAFGLYRRVTITATSDSGEQIVCYTYIAGPEIESDLDDFPVIVSGDWFNQNPLPAI